MAFPSIPHSKRKQQKKCCSLTYSYDTLVRRQRLCERGHNSAASLAIVGCFQNSSPTAKGEETFERLLADEQRRDEFYGSLINFSKGVGIALSTQRFLETVNEQKQRLHKSDLKRFTELWKSVKLQYTETIDYQEYLPKIEKMLLLTDVFLYDVFNGKRGSNSFIE